MHTVLCMTASITISTNRIQGNEVTLGTKEIRDLTRIERIGAHSHIRGMTNIYRVLRLFYLIFRHMNHLFRQLMLIAIYFQVWV